MASRRYSREKCKKMKSRRWSPRYTKTNGSKVRGSCRKRSKQSMKKKRTFKKGFEKKLRCKDSPKTYKQHGYWRKSPSRKYVKAFCRTPSGAFETPLMVEEEVQVGRLPLFTKTASKPAMLALPAPEMLALPLRQATIQKARTAQPYAQPPVFGFSARKAQPYEQGPIFGFSARAAQPYAQAKPQSPLAAMLQKEAAKEEVKAASMRPATIRIPTPKPASIPKSAARVPFAVTQGACETFYELPAGYTKSAVNKAFRQLSLSYHPDKNPADPTIYAEKVLPCRDVLMR